MATIAEFVAKAGVTMEWEKAFSNPSMDDDRGMFHYSVKLSRREGKPLTLVYSKGSALPEPPTVEEVLDCLGSDAAGYEDEADFENWALGHGYDTDSRKALAIYALVGQQSMGLAKLLGVELYTELLYNTERE